MTRLQRSSLDYLAAIEIQQLLMFSDMGLKWATELCTLSLIRCLLTEALTEDQSSVSEGETSKRKCAVLTNV